MRVRDLLSREHAMFRRLLDALDAGLSHPETQARAELTAALHTLLPLLDRHEELDDFLFRDDLSPYDENSSAARTAQHHSVSVLREEILYALELADRCPFERLRSLSRFLVANLRQNLDSEERHLWPQYTQALDRQADFDFASPLNRRARVLERQLRRGLASIAASAH